MHLKNSAEKGVKDFELLSKRNKLARFNVKKIEFA